MGEMIHTASPAIVQGSLIILYGVVTLEDRTEDAMIVGRWMRQTDCEMHARKVTS